MTVKDLVVLLPQDEFIAVGTKKMISYSGTANRFKWFRENEEVVKIIPSHGKNDATIIYIR